MVRADAMLDRTDRRFLRMQRRRNAHCKSIDLCIVPKPYPPGDIRGCVNLYNNTMELFEEGHLPDSVEMVRWFSDRDEYENRYDRTTPVRVFVAPWIA